MRYLLLNKLFKLNLVPQFFVILFIFCFQTWCYGTEVNSRLWKIDKNGKEPSYILATMHSEDPRILILPDNYNKIFIGAKSFTAEIDLSIDNTEILTKAMMLPANKKLKKIIGENLFKKSVIILNDYGIPENIINQMKPWAVLMTLSYPKPKTGLFLDKLLFDKAIKMKKKYYGLETVQEQIAIFDNASYAEQRILLLDSIKQYPSFEKQLEIIKQLYIKGDLDGLREYNKKVMLKGNYQVAEKFMIELLDKRNIKMVYRMKPRLGEGGAFIAVGALHLPGNAGILQLLREQEYQLTPIKLQ
ncbi:MAG: TraB/GumN family protein [Thiohalomonadales bacterium]